MKNKELNGKVIHTWRMICNYFHIQLAQQRYSDIEFFGSAKENEEIHLFERNKLGE